MREIKEIGIPNLKPMKPKQVAAYARVSSDKDAMLHSLSAQVSYYNDYIGKRKDWILVGVYADEAYTGTKDSRPEFQRLLSDCREKKIDLVITKSITRFARNTVTLLETVRELKILGIDIFFEEENIHSLSADGELMLTLLASYAQNQSLAVSENMKWRIRKMLAEGRPNTGNMLGYRLVDGALRIVPEEAKIVKQIFDDYLSGMGRIAIIKKLNQLGIPPRYGETWGTTSIYDILRNEKYTGNMLLQKTYSLDHLSKKTVKNKGELPMYYVENSHEAVIDKDTFEKVQQEIVRRAKYYGRHSQEVNQKEYPFTHILKCGNCGKHYRRKIANAGSKYEKPIWICSTFNQYGKGKCPSHQIPESILEQKTAEALKIPVFDEKIAKQKIKHIVVLPDHVLLYVFSSNQSVLLQWGYPSRRESWTNEMKQAAREKTLKRLERSRNEPF